MKLELDAPIVVTGAGGVIGTALTDLLRARGYTNVIAVDSRVCDLREQPQTAAFFAKWQPVLVFHLAARVAGIMGNIVNRASAFVDNIRINTNVIQAAQEFGCKKIVAMGTTAIYSDIAPLPMREEDIWFGPPHASEAPYGHAKRAMLAQLEAFHEQYGLEYAYCVSTNLYGPNDKFDEQFGHVVPSLISKFARAAREGSSISVWGDGSPQRDFLYSDDAADALLLIAEHGSGAINLASRSTVPIRKVVEILARISNFSGQVAWDTTKPNGQMLREYDLSRLLSLGFMPRHSLEDGLERTYRWFLENEQTVRR